MKNETLRTIAAATSVAMGFVLVVKKMDEIYALLKRDIEVAKSEIDNRAAETRRMLEEHSADTAEKLTAMQKDVNIIYSMVDDIPNRDQMERAVSDGVDRALEDR